MILFMCKNNVCMVNLKHISKFFSFIKNGACWPEATTNLSTRKESFLL